MEPLREDIIIAKTFINKLGAVSDENSIKNVTITNKDLIQTLSWARKQGFTIDSTMDCFSYLRSFRDVFKLMPDGKSFGLVVENLKDEKGQISLNAFFVGMFVPQYYSTPTLNTFDFDENDAYRTSGPWSAYSWALVATTVSSMPWHKNYSNRQGGYGGQEWNGQERKNDYIHTSQYNTRIFGK